MFLFSFFVVCLCFRVQSLRRSMRRSFRGRSRSASVGTPGIDGASDRKKIVQSLNRDAGLREKGSGGAGRRVRGAGRPRVNSEPTATRYERSQSPPPTGPDQVPPEMMGVITYLTFSETHVSGW